MLGGFGAGVDEMEGRFGRLRGSQSFLSSQELK